MSIKRAEIVFGRSITLKSGSFVVASSCGVVLRNAPALLIKIAKYKFVVMIAPIHRAEPIDSQPEARGRRTGGEKKLGELESGG
jgi:hypothetical protein